MLEVERRRRARQADALQAVALFVVSGLQSFMKPAIAPALDGWGFEALLVNLRLYGAFDRARDRVIVKWLTETVVTATREKTKVERHATLEHLVYASTLAAQKGKDPRTRLLQFIEENPVRELQVDKEASPSGLFAWLLRRWIGDPSLSERSLAQRFKTQQEKRPDGRSQKS